MSGATVKVLRFPPVFDLDSVRHYLNRLADRTQTPFCVDLQRCERFDIIALLRLISVVAARQESGTATSFRLPADATARRFLRRRGFHAAIERIAEVPFRLLVEGDWPTDHAERSSDDHPHENADAAIQAYLDNRKFFHFSHYDVGTPTDRVSVIEREWRRWQNPLIVEVLRSRLSQAHPHDVSRVVVQEMLTSLLTHAASGSVVCVSQIDDAPAHPRPSLVIAAWHSADPPGNGLFELLMTTIGAPERRKRFVLAYDNRRARRPASSPAQPAMRPAGDRPAPPEDNAATSDGLEALCQFVIDEFSGTIDLWSGTRFTRVARNDLGEADYQILIRDRETHGTAGDLIAVRLPLS